MKEKIIVYINGPFKVICLLLWNGFFSTFWRKKISALMSVPSFVWMLSNSLTIHQKEVPLEGIDKGGGEQVVGTILEEKTPEKRSNTSEEDRPSVPQALCCLFVCLWYPRRVLIFELLWFLRLIFLRNY